MVHVARLSVVFQGTFTKTKRKAHHSELKQAPAAAMATYQTVPFGCLTPW